MSEKRCYTVQELQEILGVSRPTIYNLLKKKEFRWMCCWYFRQIIRRILQSVF